MDLSRFIKTEPANIVNLSGGKDSTAMLLLAIERETPNLLAVFADTGNEHPLTYEYIEYLRSKLLCEILTVKQDFSAKLEHRREVAATKWLAEGLPESRIEEAREALKPTGIPFLDLCLLRGRFPSTTRRFCTQFLKKEAVRELVFDKFLAEGIDVESWQGIRKEESAHRAKALERDFAYRNEETEAEVWNYRPILDFTAQDCFDTIKKHGLEPNPLYKLGFSRVGCMPCIHCRKTELLEIAKRFPDQIEKIASWEDRVTRASKRRDATFFPMTPIREKVEWSKTARGGKQFDFDFEGIPSCKSEYGLCE